MLEYRPMFPLGRNTHLPVDYRGRTRRNRCGFISRPTEVTTETSRHKLRLQLIMYLVRPPRYVQITLFVTQVWPDRDVNISQLAIYTYTNTLLPLLDLRDSRSAFRCSELKCKDRTRTPLSRPQIRPSTPNDTTDSSYSVVLRRMA